MRPARAIHFILARQRFNVISHFQTTAAKKKGKYSSYRENRRLGRFPAKRLRSCEAANYAPLAT
jgi:hypothetical protein